MYCVPEINLILYINVPVCVFSHVLLFMTSWTEEHQGSMSFTIYQSLLKLMSIGDAIQLSHPLSPLSPPAFNLSQSFPMSSVLCIRWPKYWSFSFSISPSNEYSGLMSFRIDWFDFLAVQGILHSLLQHHSSKVSILRHSAFFMVQLSHSYMTTGKTIAFTIWPFISKVMSLLFNTCLGLS